MWIAWILTVAALFCDRKTGRIPNGLTRAGTITGIVLAGLGGLKVAGDACIGWILPVLILWVPWKLHMIGAGDVKLLGMCGAFAGSSKSVEILGLTFAAGAVYALAVMVRRGNGRARFRYLTEYLSAGVRSGVWPEYLREEDTDARITFAWAIMAGQLLACIHLLF